MKSEAAPPFPGFIPSAELPVASLARRHMVYQTMLDELPLEAPDALHLKRELGLDAEEAYARGIRSTPSPVLELFLARHCFNLFGESLHGVPGFYYERRRDEQGDFGRWAINLSNRQGRFIKPHYDSEGRIAALYVLRKAFDSRSPRLLDSGGLSLGTAATLPMIERVLI